MAVGNTSSTEVTLDLTEGGTTEQEGAGTGGVLESEGVKFSARATSGNDAGAGSLGETEGDNVHFLELKLTFVIGDGTNNNSGAVRLLAKVLDELGKRDRGTGGPGGQESAQNSLAETGVGAARKEAEELDKELVVEVLALGGGLVVLLEATALD